MGLFKQKLDSSVGYDFQAHTVKRRGPENNSTQLFENLLSVITIERVQLARGLGNALRSQRVLSSGNWAKRVTQSFAGFGRQFIHQLLELRRQGIDRRWTCERSPLNRDGARDMVINQTAHFLEDRFVLGCVRTRAPAPHPKRPALSRFLIVSVVDVAQNLREELGPLREMVVHLW